MTHGLAFRADDELGQLSSADGGVILKPLTIQDFYPTHRAAYKAAPWGSRGRGRPFVVATCVKGLNRSIGTGNTIVVLFSEPTSDNVCRNRICIAIGWPSIVSAASRSLPAA